MVIEMGLINWFFRTGFFLFGFMIGWMFYAIAGLVGLLVFMVGILIAYYHHWNKHGKTEINKPHGF